MFHLQSNGSSSSKDAEISKARLHELGEYLKRTREAKGKTIDEVVEATKIRSRYVLAIEDGDFSVLPGIVYARGFVRGYADYLGLDGAKITNQYLGSSAEPSQEESVAPKTVVSPPAMPPRKSKPAEGTRVMAERKRSRVVGKPVNHRRSKSSAIMWIAGVVLLFTAAVVAYSSFSSPSSSSPKTPPSGTGQSNAGSVVAKTHVTKPKHHPKTVLPSVQFVQTATGNYSTTYSVMTNKPLRVSVKAVSGKCWFEVTADGNVIVPSLTLQPGGEQIWKANNSITLLIGDSANIEMTINGVNAPLNKHANAGFTYTFNRK